MGGMTYRDAGVDIDKKMSTLKDIGALVKTTFTPGVLHDVGAFGGMFRGRFPELADPILVATNDGVGTKVRTGVRAGRLRGLGHDIVNHCVDDILVQGAEPLFFFDYFASSVLDPAVFHEVVEGLAEACKAVDCALLGGETAEMPGVYCDNEFDIVGFVVGVVDRSRVMPARVAAGDAVIGIRSDGLHTNGFSLVNRLIERDDLDLDQDPGGLGESLADALLRPHRCYLPPIRTLREAVDVHALAHITGGGLKDNIPRVLPEGVGCEIDRAVWTPNPVFRWLRQVAELEAEEAYHVFNMGCGMTVMTAPEDAEQTVRVLQEAGEEAWIIGRLVEGEGVTFTDDLT
ncbi:MAG: phosphoribosylformylglycinamidine cyclo-ligase [Planctomycetota bacterium]|nr:phosphoribosylformylglycinamidine cyclo-ligase [Planctomycetota bacterium]